MKHVRAAPFDLGRERSKYNGRREHYPKWLILLPLFQLRQDNNVKTEECLILRQDGVTVEVASRETDVKLVSTSSLRLLELFPLF